ncbi:MAG: mechanosensitive ion channel family protein, partial [Nitrospirae bacterium]|nr:mechanosensitive ion channel family protein [Nitrospirota bacterium]
MDINLKRILIPVIITLISASVLFVIRSIAFRLLHKWAARTETKIDDIVIKSLKIPSIYWCIAIGLYIGVAISELPER